MNVLALTEATKFLRSYGVKCDKKLVEEWLNNTYISKNLSYHFCEEDLYDFNEWCRWKGTAYEKGIDDQTKIARLLEEIADLRNEVSALKKEKEDLVIQLGVTPF